MLDIGWSELAIVAVLALLVIGPKDLPGVMRTVGQWMRKARSLSREFQSSLDEMVREAELDEARDTFKSARSMNVRKALSDTIDPTGEMEETARDIDRTARSETVPAAGDHAAAREDKDEGNKISGTKKEATDEPKAEPKTEPKAERVDNPVSIAPGNSVKPPAEPQKTKAKAKAETKAEPAPRAQGATDEKKPEKSASGSGA